MTKCLETTCTREATATVAVRLPRQIDKQTVLAESARYHVVPLCAEHAAWLRLRLGPRVES